MKAEAFAVRGSGAFRYLVTQCQGGKASARILVETTIAAHQSGRGYKANRLADNGLQSSQDCAVLREIEH